MENTQHSPEYICTRLGEENAASVNFGAVTPPVYSTSLHVFDDIQSLINYDPTDAKGRFIYGRVDNPTTMLLEKKLAALEGAGGALCFASGMAAISAAILYGTRPGGHVVAVKNCYGPTKKLLTDYLSERGVETTFVSGQDPEEFSAAIRPNTTMFYLESPTTAVMELQDLPAVTKIAKAHGIKTAIDNTWATPIYQRPIELGVDIVLYTMSKYIGGHSDIIGGALCASAEIVAEIKCRERELIGGILGPFESWLAIRGLRTFPERLKKSSENARAVVALLDESNKVRRVNYPGAKTYQQNELAARQLRGGSGLLSFELDASPEVAIAFANNLEHFRKGVSWGGFESLVCMPCFKQTEEGAKSLNTNRNLIRLYCGLESVEELLSDVAGALKKL